MHPLVSGPEAKRYLRPETEIYLLFPYELGDEGASLTAAEKFEREYPNAWSYLKSYESVLRGRENSTFDDGDWYRFGRHQNLDKQEISKLLVPRLVSNLAAYVDEVGEFYLDNVDVGGVSAADGLDSYFLVGCLNGPVTNWVFRRISKPFRGDYRSANKQYIAPLPIPDCSKAQRGQIASLARKLQERHSSIRDLQSQLRRRLDSAATRNELESWVFPDIGAPAAWQDRAPSAMGVQERASWARHERAHALDARYEDIQHHMHPGALLEPNYETGELRFLLDGRVIIDRVFVDDKDGPFIAAQWSHVADTFSITDKTKAKALVSALRKLSATDNPALKTQVIELQGKISEQKEQIAGAEEEINQLLFDAYGLSEAEKKMVLDG